jgi:hypothetical protein
MRFSSKFLYLGLLAIPALSAANPLTIEFDKPDLGNDYIVTYGGQKLDAFVGSLYFSVPPSKKQFVTFCVDLTHEITNGQMYAVNPVFTSSLAASNVYREAGDVLDAGIKTATDANHAAALQLAIWKTVYGNQFSVAGVSNTVLAEEAADIAAGAKTKGNAIFLQDAPGSKGQSQITTTPEPTGLAILGIGVFGLFFRRRKDRV